jgi:hypothetical protein
MPNRIEGDRSETQRHFSDLSRLRIFRGLRRYLCASVPWQRCQMRDAELTKRRALTLIRSAL